jgi:hypothetical protein
LEQLNKKKDMEFVPKWAIDFPQLEEEIAPAQPVDLGPPRASKPVVVKDKGQLVEFINGTINNHGDRKISFLDPVRHGPDTLRHAQLAVKNSNTMLDRADEAKLYGTKYKSVQGWVVGVKIGNRKYGNH